MKIKIEMRKWFSLAREEHGSALVEFAVTVPLLLFLLFAVLQGMFAMYIYHYTAYAAQQGARFAMVRGHTASGTIATPCGTSAPPNFTMAYDCEAASGDIQNYVQSLGAINPSNLTINTSNWPQTTPDCSAAPCAACTGSNYKNSKGCIVKVTANYAFNVIPFLPFTALRMSATSEKVIAQ
jgi:Flp pilus assembly protein TadG